MRTEGAFQTGCIAIRIPESSSSLSRRDLCPIFLPPAHHLASVPSSLRQFDALVSIHGAIGIFCFSFRRSSIPLHLLQLTQHHICSVATEVLLSRIRRINRQNGGIALFLGQYGRIGKDLVSFLYPIKQITPALSKVIGGPVLPLPLIMGWEIPSRNRNVLCLRQGLPVQLLNSFNRKTPCPAAVA